MIIPNILHKWRLVVWHLQEQPQQLAFRKSDMKALSFHYSFAETPFRSNIEIGAEFATLKKKMLIAINCILQFIAAKESVGATQEHFGERERRQDEGHK
jgi:hypothetical protein